MPGLGYYFGRLPPDGKKSVKIEMAAMGVAIALAVARCGSVASVADRLGVTPTAISHWVNGTHAPYPKNIQALADLIEIDVAWILSPATTLVNSERKMERG